MNPAAATVPAPKPEAPLKRDRPVYRAVALPGVDDAKGEEVLIRFLREVAEE